MKKEEFIRVRVAGWQKKYISLQAEKAHKSLSQYVRDAAMDKDVTVIDGVDDLIRELRRQGNIRAFHIEVSSAPGTKRRWAYGCLSSICRLPSLRSSNQRRGDCCRSRYPAYR